MASRLLKPLVKAIDGAHTRVIETAARIGWQGVQLQPLEGQAGEQRETQGGRGCEAPGGGGCDGVELEGWRLAVEAAHLRSGVLRCLPALPRRNCPHRN